MIRLLGKRSQTGGEEGEKIGQYIFVSVNQFRHIFEYIKTISKNISS